MTFGIQLTATLRATKVSKAELARRIPCGRASVSDWCSGKHLPRPEQLARINEVLGTQLTLRRRITAREVARMMGIGVRTLRRAMKDGAIPELGFIVSSPSGKRHRYVFYNKILAEKLGI